MAFLLSLLKCVVNRFYDGSVCVHLKIHKRNPVRYNTDFTMKAILVLRRTNNTCIWQWGRGTIFELDVFKNLFIFPDFSIWLQISTETSICRKTVSKVSQWTGASIFTDNYMASAPTVWSLVNLLLPCTLHPSAAISTPCTVPHSWNAVPGPNVGSMPNYLHGMRPAAVASSPWNTGHTYGQTCRELLTFWAKFSRM